MPYYQIASNEFNEKECIQKQYEMSMSLSLTRKQLINSESAPTE